jgi:glycine/D-amino acid oxidase-like deaminating enzyme
MNSVWGQGVIMPKFRSLNNNIATDVLIVGGGMAGILCAHFLQSKGIKYALVEGKRIANGITKNTTAKITGQHGLIYDKLIKKAGTQKATQYLQANLWALDEYKNLCQTIDCDFEEKPSFVYTLNDVEAIENEVIAVNKLGFKATFVRNTLLPLDIKAAIKFKNQAQFNPLKFISHIAKGLNIYEDTFVDEIKGNIAITKNGKIKAKKIIIATHFPIINSAGLYFMKMYQHRSYVIALKDARLVDGMYVDEAQNGMSFRNYKDLLLIGGGDHRTGKQGGNWRELRNFAKTHYPDAHEEYFWATQDCMTLDSVPYIGQYSELTPDIYVATGFNKWGMTSSMVSAKILCDMVEEKKNDFEEVFSPQRSIMKKQLLMNTLETGVNFLSFKTKRCSHLGCALEWNKYEKSWDCPCHGSRFSKEGKIIDNPAMRDIDV